MNRDYVLACSLALVAALAVPASASPRPGEDPPRDQRTPGDRIVVEEIRSSFVFAPEVRLAEIDDRGTTLLGGYAGVLFDRTLLVGGAGYWMPDKFHSLRFGYAGGIVEWRARPAGPVTVAVRGLAGGGAVTSGDVWIMHEDRCWGGDDRWDRWTGRCGSIDWSRYESFLIAEPQASVIFRVAPIVAINIGAGYRFIGQAHGYEDRLRGGYASFAVEIGK